ncbi:FAD-dependent oxidoreductase [Streptomyces sp. NPDC047043]|uniref:NAD(P)/FAD-dependent oxidoreductase n=1 Tax=Streptomyces sp. NPDC047043 TaxID=3154497 RepID=UPI0033CC9C7D
MSGTEQYVVVGGCAAGVSAAFALRQHGFEGSVVLLEAGTEAPYRRPQLSKVLGDTPDALRPIADPESYAERRIDLRLGTRVERLDPAARTVHLADGTSLHADKVLLATGVAARRPDLPGIGLDGVLSLRDPDDALRLGKAIRDGGPVVVLGGGFIGMEVAAVARTAGCEVTVLEAAPAPMLAALGRELADLVTAFHRERGVRVLTDAKVTALDGNGTVEAVVLASGERIPATTVVVGVGVVPNDRLAAEAGVRCDGGIVVDLHGRTSDPWVFAAGDVTVQPHPHLAAAGRIEHWDNAQQQGVVAARAMLGELQDHDTVPYFWSEQYGLQLQMVGRPRPGDTQVLRKDATPSRFMAFWLRDGGVVAAAGLDTVRDVVAARRLIARSASYPVDQLADPGTDLRALARS